MTPATRFGLAGIGGLALLSAAHWLRAYGPPLPPVGEYLLGVLPNFAAAIAIAFVPLSAWMDQHREADRRAITRAFAVCAAISLGGLIGWEFFQKTGTRLVFDPHDLAATLAGTAVAGLLFVILRPRARNGP